MKHRRFDITEILLRDNRTDVSPPALHVAATPRGLRESQLHPGHRRVLKLLLERPDLDVGARLPPTRREFATALDAALAKGYTDFAELILESRPDVDYNWNATVMLMAYKGNYRQSGPWLRS